MITNIWKSIKFYCPEHKEPVALTIQTKGTTPFYACPKYYPKNRDPDEFACVNHINLNEYEAAIKHISDILVESELNNEKTNLASHKWTRKGIDFEVFSHTRDTIKVYMKNKNALHQR